MDYLKHVEQIIELLQSHGLNETSKRIEVIRESSFTSTEFLFKVTHELLLLIKDQKLYVLIGEEVIQLKDYCHSIGIIVN